MEGIKWRFPGNNYTEVNGLDTPGKETFKKDVIESLAREICQNSIDAKLEGCTKPVRVVFQSFKIKSSLIPGREAIIEQLKACLNTWEENKKYKEELTTMLESISSDEVECLRISDFNTTGLKGVEGKEKSSWKYLIHGSGVSDKSETSGGSKGIGKFAAFVASKFATVFYSTKTCEGYVGYEGVCRLCSANMKGTAEQTQGVGYYGSSITNTPIFEELKLDPNFKRRDNEYGSDIYILGFKRTSTWKRDIISKILESFITAILFKTLVADVDGTIIDDSTIGNIIDEDELINNKNKQSIISQYLLLTDSKTYIDHLTVEGIENAVTLYTHEFEKNEQEKATRACTMVRYPYMKIKDIKNITTLPCSVMCLIGDNDLNKLLRSVENPQHSDWEFNRIEDTSARNEARRIYRDLNNEIKKCVSEHLEDSDENKTDLEGASDYLPGESDVGDNSGITSVITEKVELSKKKSRVKHVDIGSTIPSDNGDGVIIELGSSDQEGEEEFLGHEGENNGGGGKIAPSDEKEPGSLDEDEGHETLKPHPLRRMNYRFFCINKKESKYCVSFISDYTLNDLDFELYALDDGNNCFPVKIFRCEINGKEFEVLNEKTVKIDLKTGERYKLILDTDQKELFSGEVKIYEHR